MPTYEYVCSKCDHHFDLSQSIKDQAVKICPKDQCGRRKWGKGKVKRAIGTGGGLIFKGSGFYTTDYRSEKYKEAAKKDAPAAPAAPASSTEKKSTTESKPAAAKPEAKAASPAKT